MGREEERRGRRMVTGREREREREREGGGEWDILVHTISESGQLVPDHSPGGLLRH